MTNSIHFIEAGFDKDNKSVILDERDISPVYPVPACKEFSITDIYHTEDIPLTLHSKDANKPYEINLSPGAKRFLICRIPPIHIIIERLNDPTIQSAEDFINFGMHTTPTVDYFYVIHGEMSLYMLDEPEPTQFKTGDAYAMRGAAHAWVNYSETTCEMVGMMLGVNVVLSQNL